MTKTKIDSIKRRTALLLMPLGLMFGVAFAISWLGHIGSASAHTLQAAVIPAADTSPTANQIVDLLLSGKYLVAVGLLMPALVALMRVGLGKLSSWFETKTGGVVLVYATSTLLYLGTAWASGSAFDLRMLLLAIASGMAASGAWEHIKDVFGGAKVSTVTKATSGSLLVLMVALVASCATARPVASGAVTAELDCTSGAALEVVKSLGNATQEYLRSKISGDGSTVNTDEIKADIKALGSKAWSCAVSVALNILLSQPSARTSLAHAVGPTPNWAPALAAVKSELGVATIVLPDGSKI